MTGRHAALLLAAALTSAGSAVLVLVPGRTAGRSAGIPWAGYRHPEPFGPGAEWLTTDWTDRPARDGNETGVGWHETFPLTGDAAAKAVGELDRRHAVELTEDEFRAYTGRPGLPANRPTPFLVRGVEVDGLPIQTQNIQYGSSGVMTVQVFGWGGTTPILKRPVVFLLYADVRWVTIVIPRGV